MCERGMSGRPTAEYDQMVWELMFALQGVAEGHHSDPLLEGFVQYLVDRTERFFGEGAWRDLCQHLQIDWPESTEVSL